jgi:hypothetical protein
MFIRFHTDVIENCFQAMTVFFSPHVKYLERFKVLGILTVPLLALSTKAPFGYHPVHYLTTLTIV